MEKLQKLMDDYRRDCGELLRKESFLKNTLTDMVAERNQIKDDPMHMAFYEAVQQCIAEVADTKDPALAADAAQTLLCPKGDSTASVQSWWLMVAETAAEPLIPLLDDGVLRPIYEDYTRRYPRRVRLPKQQQLCTQMADRLKIPRLKRR